METDMYDVYGVTCYSYEEACIVAGIDTPAQLEAEDAWYATLNEVENLTNPVDTEWCICVRNTRKAAYDLDDFIPF
jgi:hypothetical protein